MTLSNRVRWQWRTGASPVLRESSLSRTVSLRLQVILNGEFPDGGSHLHAGFVRRTEVDATIETTQRRFGGGRGEAREVAEDTGRKSEPVENAMSSLP